MARDHVVCVASGDSHGSWTDNHQSSYNAARESVSAISADRMMKRPSLQTKASTPETIGESVYRRIRSDIIFGILPPGQKLRLEKVSESYGTSISTLRELLNRMCAEGLIVAEGQRGFEVASVSAEDFRQVAALRILLENHAMEQSFQLGDLDWEGRVVSAHHKLAVMERRLLAGDRLDQKLWKQCDWDLHHALISACGSSVLLEAHALIYDRYLRYQMIAVIFRGEIAAREHQQLLECALVRDSKKAQAILVSHVDGCVEDALRNDAVGIFGESINRAAVVPSSKGDGKTSAKKHESGPTRTLSRSPSKR
jgi:DNA-binding GntR family transcriptional regulator